MSCEGYTPSALMGNWFEEKGRYHQPNKMNPEARHVRIRFLPPNIKNHFLNQNPS